MPSLWFKIRSPVIYSVATAIFATLIVLRFHNDGGWHYDFGVYKSGVDEFFAGTSLYDSHSGFTYPPFGVLFLFWAHFLSAGTGALVFSVVSIALAYVTVVRYTNWSNPWAIAAVTGVLVLLMPGRLSLMLGQVTFVILVVTALDLTARDSRRFKGVGIGLIAGLKLIPGIFILYFLITKRWRAALVSSATFLATVAVGALFLPKDSWNYWTSVVFDTSRVGMPQNVSSETILGIIIRWTRDPSGHTAIYLVAAIVVAVLGLLLAKKCHDRGEELLAIATCNVIIVLVLPLAWTFYWEWAVVPLFIRLFQIATKEKRVGVAVFLGLLLVEFALYPSLHALTTTMPGQELTLPLADQILTSTHAVAAVAVLIGIAILIRGRSRPDGSLDGRLPKEEIAAHA